ncbi:MAG: extracellular solute-binding protein [Planctomycetota bacterium]|jgi:iron(III) transport system substrate-binding protein|nr:extracellular solute-binding protein [Planctomycetota bacterium]
MSHRIVRLALALFLFATPLFAGTVLVAYTDMEPDVLNRYRRDLAEKFPDLSIKWVRESGGPITARLLAEKDNPQADIIFGLALSGVLAVDRQGGLETYRPEGMDSVPPMLRDDRDHPTWAGMNVVVGALAVNTRECERLGIPVPESWRDPIKPEYRGHIVMPNPLSSGTAYLHVTGWLQNLGEDKAWEFMEALDKNVKMYVHSGSKPAQMAAMGETPIGVSVDAYIATYLKKRTPLETVVPVDGVGWDIVAATLVKGGKNPEAARRLMDYAVSPDSARIGLEFDYLPVRPENDGPRQAELCSRLLPMDLRRAAEERDRVLAEWRRRFGSE